jgi:hypothetical protein
MGCLASSPETWRRGLYSRGSCPGAPLLAMSSALRVYASASTTGGAVSCCHLKPYKSDSIYSHRDKNQLINKNLCSESKNLINTTGMKKIKVSKAPFLYCPISTPAALRHHFKETAGCAKTPMSGECAVSCSAIPRQTLGAEQSVSVLLCPNKATLPSL